MCPFTGRVLRFLEKPSEEETKSRKASVVFYCFRAQTVHLLEKYLLEFPSVRTRSMGLFVKWLLESEQRTVFGLKLPTGFQLIGETTLSDYEHWLRYFGEQEKAKIAGGGNGRGRRIVKRAYARVGVSELGRIFMYRGGAINASNFSFQLMGNPSDGFFGKTISLSIKNFWAEVRKQRVNQRVNKARTLFDR